MVSEIGRPGDWIRALQAPHLDKFGAPTVEGVAFPSMGLYQAWNDPATGTLNVGTYAAAPDKRGAATTFNITNLPDAKTISMTADGQPFTRFEVTSPTSIRVDTTIEMRQFRIVTGYRGAQQKADREPPAPRERAAAAAGLSGARDLADNCDSSTRPAPLTLLTPTSAGCACCQS
jgi:hypothetical protein